MNERIRRLSKMVLALAALAASVGLAPPGALGQSIVHEAALVPLDGDLTPAVAHSAVARIERAVERRASFIVVELAASGSDLGAARQVKEAILRVPREIETVAYVRAPTTGAPVLVALACDLLAIGPTAKLGDCGPVASPELGKELATLAGLHGQPRALCAALADARESVFHVKLEDESGVDVEGWLTASDLAGLKNRRYHGKREVVRAGEPLVLDAALAKETGLATWIPRTRADLISDLENRARGPLVIREIDATGALGRLLAWLAREGLLPIFLFLGLLGICIEAYHPGLVVPGALGVLCLVVALSGGHLAGLTDMLDMALIFGGIALILIEMFILPGFGATGITGILCVLAGAFLAMQASMWPRTEAEVAAWASGVRTFLIGVVGTAAGFAAFVRIAPRSPLFRALMHTSKQAAADGYVVASSARVALIGRPGVAATDLRPSGKIVVGGEELDAVSDGGWIGRGSAVEVIDTSENRIVVKKV